MPQYEYEQPQSNLRPAPVKKQEFRQPKQRHPESKGAVWIKQNSAGVEYLSIKLELNEGEVINLKAFLNSDKRSPDDAKPTYILYESKGIIKERNGNK